MTRIDLPFPNTVQRQRPLARHTAARLGGIADYLFIAKDPDFRDASALLQQAWKMKTPVTIIGGGANILVSDKGIRGLTIINRATRINHQPSGGDILLTATSGVNLIRLARYCQERGFAGLEWAIAVPGTVGGAVVNNAGAHGTDTASSLQRVKLFDSTAGEHWREACHLRYGYRESSLKSRDDRRFFLQQACFKLRRDAPAAIQKRMDAYSDYRKQTQPPGATLGSIFKNPPNDFAGRLIEAAQLKGLRIGGAQVSPIHANFFVNVSGQASAQDYLRLIQVVQARVQKTFNIALELEIQTIGDWT